MVAMSTGHTSKHGTFHRHAALFLSAVTAIPGVIAAPAHATATRAGTLINNTATATYDNNGTPATVNSNTVTLKVDEVIDVAVATRDSGDASIGAGSAGNVRSFTVTNAGNGAEAYILSAVGQVGGNQFDPDVTAIAVDTNGNGVYDPGTDQVVANGAVTAPIDPDTSLTVFVISSAPAGATDTQRGSVRLRAVAQTGSGPVGTAFAGQGAGGGDAVVGASTGSQDALSGFVISRAGVRFEKSAVVADPNGGTHVIPGSIITYRLVTTVQGSGTLPGLKVQDAIPAGTTYVAGSLRLDAVVLTDAVDGDAGTGGSNGIDVSLGNVVAGATRTTEFAVKIN